MALPHVQLFHLAHQLAHTMRRSVKASSFTACLELAREGLLDLRQDGNFAPIYVRKRTAA